MIFYIPLENLIPIYGRCVIIGIAKLYIYCKRRVIAVGLDCDLLILELLLPIHLTLNIYRIVSCFLKWYKCSVN